MKTRLASGFLFARLTRLRRSVYNYNAALRSSPPPIPRSRAARQPGRPISDTPARLALIGSAQIPDYFPTSVRLEKSLRESLKRLAKERRWSMSTLIQQVLEAFVRAEDKKKK